ncbi:hypothetical protein [Eubacterium ventriosum]|uniref:hypothetical protein n=1 Tax=Eubacterium ventriosum TaxID=39496 RepID=UPI00265FCFCA|nr:hypothetical protein [Eubacterium ventriosum]
MTYGFDNNQNLILVISKDEYDANKEELAQRLDAFETQFSNALSDTAGSLSQQINNNYSAMEKADDDIRADYGKKINSVLADVNKLASRVTTLEGKVK